jgi:hypothetical protein
MHRVLFTDRRIAVLRAVKRRGEAGQVNGGQLKGLRVQWTWQVVIRLAPVHGLLAVHKGSRHS